MTAGLTDTHCHLTLEAFADDLDEVLGRARAAGVQRIVVPGIDLPTSRRAVSLAERAEGVYAAVGVHPHNASSWSRELAHELRALARSDRVCAIGETGLDFYRNLSTPAEQQRAFRAQLDLAAELGLPALVHNREATAELLEVLIEWAKSLSGPLAGRAGVLHAYSADVDAAVDAVSAGFFLGIAGPITYQNAHSRRQITKALPLGSLVIETDAPYLAPHPHRGRRNEPAHLALIASQLAALHGLQDGEVASVTSSNAAVLFGWNHGSRNDQLH